MTPAQLIKLAPAAEKYALALIAASVRFDVSTPLRQAHWLAQIAHESGGFSKVRESLNYSVEALLNLFGRHRISAEDAERYGRSPAHQADQKALADRLYGGEFGLKNLGNTQPHDGSLFIGRGLKQLTGRDNYTRCSQALYGDDRLVLQPDLLEQPEAAALSAGWFWSINKINAAADRDDVAAVTKIVNGGSIGLAERTVWLHRAKAGLL